MTALSKWDVYDSDEVNWEPHTLQEEIVASSARFRVVSAGRRFGKSQVGGHELLPEAFVTYSQKESLLTAALRREFWIVGPAYTDAEKEFRVVYNLMKKLEMPFDRPGTYYDAVGGSMHISAFEGTFQVHAKSAMHPESLVGEGLSGVILAEAAKLKERVWTKAIRPTLADFMGWMLATSTPEGRNWFHEMYQAGQDPFNPDWASWRCPSWGNHHVYRTPTLTRDVTRLQAMLENPKIHDNAIQLVKKFKLKIDPEIVSLIMDLTAESFNQEIAAKFTDFVGRVFKDFDEDIHVGDFEYEPGWETYGAVDWGFTNPSVWLLIQIGTWGQIRVLDELYTPGLTAEEFSKEVKARGLCPAGTKTFYADPAAPGDTRVMENILKVNSTGGTGGELNPRLDAIRKALKPRPFELPNDHPDKIPQLMIDRGCTNLIREMSVYRYPDNKKEVDKNSPELPLKKDDHSPEALGRLIAGKFLTPQRQAMRARTRSGYTQNAKSGMWTPAKR